MLVGKSLGRAVEQLVTTLQHCCYANAKIARVTPEDVGYISWKSGISMVTSRVHSEVADKCREPHCDNQIYGCRNWSCFHKYKPLILVSHITMGISVRIAFIPNLL